MLAFEGVQTYHISWSGHVALASTSGTCQSCYVKGGCQECSGCLQDVDESDEEGDTDLRDMDSAFQPSAAESPTRRVTREAS